MEDVVDASLGDGGGGGGRLPERPGIKKEK